MFTEFFACFYWSLVYYVSFRQIFFWFCFPSDYSSTAEILTTKRRKTNEFNKNIQLSWQLLTIFLIKYFYKFVSKERYFLITSFNLFFIDKTMSHNKSLSLTKLQQSILRQYKRVSYGEQTPQYHIQSIYYSDIPKQLPTQFCKKFKKSIVLYNYSYFQIITFSLFQFIFSQQSNLRKDILDKIKKKICMQDFMFESNYIKGLIIKALHIINQEGDRSNKPIAQVFLKTQSMNAFSEFWKELIEEQCSHSCIKYNEIPEQSTFQYVSHFLGVNFQLFWQKQTGFDQQIIVSNQKITEEFISVAIFNKNLSDSIINKILDDNQEQSKQKGYVILLKSDPALKIPSKKMIQKQFDTQNLNDIRNRVTIVKKKGNQLLFKFRQFYRQVRQDLN